MLISFSASLVRIKFLLPLVIGLLVTPDACDKEISQANGSTGWVQYRGDAQRTGRASWGGPTARGVVAWRQTIGQWDGSGEPPMYNSSPIVAPSGTVFVGTGRASELAEAGSLPHLYAFTPTGQELWRSTLGGFAVYGAPALGPDGRMLVVGQKFDKGRPVVRAFVVSESGKALATVAKQHEAAGSPLVDGEGNFLYRDPTGLWMLPRRDHRSRPSPELVAQNLPNLTSGSSIGDYLSDLGDAFSCLPGCSFDTSVKVTPFYTRGILPSPAWTGRCRDVATGLWTRFWRVGQGKVLGNVNVDILATPAIGRGGTVAYVSLKSRETAAIDQTGNVLWKLSWGYQPVNIAVGRQAGTNSRSTVCTYVDASGRQVEARDNGRDRLYVRSDLGLTAINGDTGRSLWWNKTPLVGEPIVLATGSGELVLAAGESALHAFRGDNGGQLWSVPLDGPALGSPAVGNDHIYVATYRSLYAISLTD